MKTIDMRDIQPGSAYLVSPSGKAVELDPELYRLARKTVDSVDNADRTVTTGEAARLLNVSYKTVARLVDQGRITCTRTSPLANRKLRVADVLEFKRGYQSSMSEHLERSRQIAEQIGMYTPEGEQAQLEYVKRLGK